MKTFLNQVRKRGYEINHISLVEVVLLFLEMLPKFSGLILKFVNI